MSTAVPIQTRYKGCYFRSRLEARWAVYLDSVGLKWEYEKQGFNLQDSTGWLPKKYPGKSCYLPDFWLNDVNMWAEVKPEAFSDLELARARLLTNNTNHPVILLVGLPACQPYDFFQPELYGCGGCRSLGPGPDGWDMDKPTKTSLCNCLLSMFKGYPTYQHRLFTHIADDDLEDWVFDKKAGVFSDVAVGVEAALSARFEHGEAK
jgi:hypothetical protein